MFGLSRQKPRPHDERLYVQALDDRRMREWTDRQASRMRFHPDCKDCCADGKCHWNPQQVSEVAILRVYDGYTYRACASHADLLLRKSLNISSWWETRYHIDQRDGPATLRAS